MSGDRQRIPLTRDQVISLYFAEHRARVLDVAAFLDRADRALPSGGEQEFRIEALKAAIRILTDGGPQRARRILELLSDHSTDLPQSALGTKGAVGAVALSRTESASEEGSRR